MQGFLEPDNQALVTLDFGQGPLDFLIDTGFNGTLIVGEEILETRDLIPLGTLQAELASQQSFEYLRYAVSFEWFGEELLTEVLVGAGKECLIGTALLNPHRLEIDYEHRTVQLNQGSNW